jgi:Putative beta-barrel porin 2
VLPGLSRAARPVAGWILALWLLNASAAPPLEPGAESFARGVAQYRNGSYASALYLFYQAHAAGNRNPNLTYDIGLTLYQLGRDDESRNTFEFLAFTPGYESLAEYHIALIDLRAEEQARAATGLRHLAQDSEYEPLRRVAITALARMERDPWQRQRAAYASAGAGYDSNAGFQSDDLQDLADTEDSFYEMLGSLDYPFEHGPAIVASVYAREYAQMDAFSHQSAQLGLRQDYGFARWQATAAAQAESAFLGGESLHDAATASGEARALVGDGVLGLKLAVTRFAAGDIYPELGGWRERATLRYATPGATLAYELELNDRADLHAPGEFASRSPTRHQLSAGLRRPLTYRLSLEWRARYRVSRYPDADLAGGVSERRSDGLAEAELGARWRLSPNWSVLAELRHTRNSSNIAGYAYQRTGALLAIEAMLSADSP